MFLPKIDIERTSTSQGIPKSKHTKKGNAHRLPPTAAHSANGDMASANGAEHNSAFQQYTPVLGTKKRKLEPQDKLANESPEPTLALSSVQPIAGSEIDVEKSAKVEQDRNLERAIRKEKKERRKKHNPHVEESKGGEDGQTESNVVELDIKPKKKKRKERKSGSGGDDVVGHVPEDPAHDDQALPIAETKKSRKKKDRALAVETDSNDNQSSNRSTSESQIPKKGSNVGSQVDDDTKGGVEPLDDGVSGSNGQSADQSGQQRQKPDVKDDNDWLRAKTSRVLDLVDSELEAYIAEAPEPSGQSNNSSGNPKDEETEELSTSGTPGPEPSPEQNPSSAERLFVRNLPYTANQTEIENLFSKFGQLKEVRCPPNCMMFDFHDEHLIGTAYA